MWDTLYNEEINVAFLTKKALDSVELPESFLQHKSASYIEGVTTIEKINFQMRISHSSMFNMKDWINTVLLKTHQENSWFIHILSWKPSVAHRLPAPCHKLRFYLFLTLKVDPLILVSQNQAKNILVILPSLPIKFWSKSVSGFLSYERTSKQTNKQRLQLYIYRYNRIMFYFLFLLTLFYLHFYILNLPLAQFLFSQWLGNLVKFSHFL